MDVVEIELACTEMDKFIAEYGSTVEYAFEQLWGWLSPAGLGYTIPAFLKH